MLFLTNSVTMTAGAVMMLSRRFRRRLYAAPGAPQKPHLRLYATHDEREAFRRRYDPSWTSSTPYS